MQAICLGCKKKLPILSKLVESGLYICECGREIPHSSGIYRFVKNDNFYEGKFTATNQSQNMLNKLFSFIVGWLSIDGNEERMWKRSKRFIKSQYMGEQQLEILNIGAGGGHEFLNHLGLVTAIDLSLKSLLTAQKIYDFCYQANATELPFSDNAFDLVFSAHLLGHIPLNEKQKVIREIYRVTKPGGLSLHSAECEANNFFYKRAKRYPDLYKKYFKDMYGHYGLEYPSQCKKRFRDESFVPIFEISDYCKGVIRPIGSFKVFFGNGEYKEKDVILNLLASISELLSSNKLFMIITNILLYPCTVFNYFLGRDGVDSVKLLYRKPS